VLQRNGGVGNDENRDYCNQQNAASRSCRYAISSRCRLA
jgi:hypothetical protein